jgi:hypothetical protein
MKGVRMSTVRNLFPMKVETEMGMAKTRAESVAATEYQVMYVKEK